MPPVLISVIMPAYNAERFLAESIDSILAQTLDDFEFLIVDDGSTDGTKAILDRYAEKDSRVKVISRPNTGLSPALNEMIELARGEFLARMDADDVAMPRRFERQATFLRERPDHVVVGSRVQVIDPDGDPLCEWNFETTHEEIDAAHMEGSRGSVINHPSAMMRKDAVLAVGKYIDRPGEDFDLLLRLAERGRLAILPEVLLKYRMHPKSLCNDHLGAYRRAIADSIRSSIADAYRRRGIVDRQPPSQDAWSVAAVPTPEETHLKWGWWALGAGHVASARKHAWARLVGAPRSADSWRLWLCALRGS